MPGKYPDHPNCFLQQAGGGKPTTTQSQKLSNEIILGKSTEDTAMELDGEGATNYEQLRDLIRKECDKWDHKYARLEDKYNKLEQQVMHKDHQKNMAQRG